MVIGTEQGTRDRVRDQRIARIVELVSPGTLLEELPLGEGREQAVVRRPRARSSTSSTPPRTALMVVVGPCSVHDVEAALDYAGRLAPAAEGLRERPARRDAGLLREAADDDRLEGADQRPPPRRLRRRQRGAAHRPRALLLQVLDLGLPIGCEFLDPITPQYISDAVAWGAIGARTTESQIHRQLGSGLSMPIGFKNRTDGDVQVAVDAVRAAAAPHAFAGIDDNGVPAIHHTTGNPDGHVILRGGKGAPNYDAAGVEERPGEAAAPRSLPERLVIDASHDNSGKDPARQILAAGEIGEQIAAGNKAIVGVMLESFIVEGNQSAEDDSPLTYGQSITDACIYWEDTVTVLESLAAAVRARREAMTRELAVLGVGLIGGSIGLAAGERLEGAEVVGWGRTRSPSTCDRAGGDRSRRRLSRRGL